MVTGVGADFSAGWPIILRSKSSMAVSAVGLRQRQGCDGVFGY
jgi:hypothetical protein